ncbi:hypothetical protein HYQ46_006436 [Verticillium longisporum]|nr:hypothetical protein HYQ46_006436 [Verticillium longisporum]
MLPCPSRGGPSVLRFLRDAISRWSFSKKICVARRDLACICEFHKALRSATELRLSLLLRPVDSSPLRLVDSLRPPAAARREVVLAFNSAMRFRSVRISSFSLSASWAILMNWVRFCITFCWRSAWALALSCRRESWYS